MDYNIFYSNRARDDAKRIVEYIKYVLVSPQAAANFIDSLKEKEKAIIKEPHLYPSEFFGKNLYHYSMVKKYMVVFRIDENTHTVFIIAIGHSLRKRKNIVK